MELKVWVEGIQRIVCGVREDSTCQDVVLAIANATAQTGRFILVERWRTNERLLAPYEKPLKVLELIRSVLTCELLLERQKRKGFFAPNCHW